MNRREVAELMASSKNVTEWNNNADKVKAACDGYPRFWWDVIMVSGLAERNKQSWT